MPSPDISPGSHGASRLNGFIYRRMTNIYAARTEGDVISDPDSLAMRGVNTILKGFEKAGITGEEKRVAVVSSLAHIDFLRRQLLESETPEEISDQI